MPKKTPAKVGRPTLYDAKVHPQVARKLAAEGRTDVELSDVLGISRSTLGEWKVKHPEFADALQSGKAVADKEVADALFRRAKGFTYKEGSRDRVALPDVTACIFWLKNRQPDQWRDVKDINQGMTKEVQAKLTALLSEAVRANLSAADADKLMAWFEERVCVDG